MGQEHRVWGIPRITCLVLGRVLLASGALAPGPLGAAEIRTEAIVRGRSALVESQAPWIEAGFGKLTEGSGDGADSETQFQGEAQLGLDLRGGEVLRIHVHGLARSQPAAALGQQFGLVEAFALYRPELSDGTRLRVTAGMFFPPTSRENTGPLWSSPYTLTLSALNTWVAEELRLTGAEVGVSHKTSRDEFLAGLTLFGANDSAGALLAWRGWSLGDRLSSIGERLPLPPLPSLAPGGGFADQRSDGTRPVEELDGRPGFQARARWSRPEVALLQASHLDNRGDRLLHRGQYAWRTRFTSVGGEVHLGARLIVVAEGAFGNTGMGPDTGAHVDLDFAAGYLLTSWGTDKVRLSVRYDRFENRDRDGTQEPNQEDGHAVTVAALWHPTPHVRLGLEGLRLWNQRPAAADAGANPDTGAKRLLAELRLQF
jgi:hypothetical protein